MNVSRYGRIIEEISMDQVHLEKTTWDAIDDILKLKVTKEQKGFVAKTATA